VRRAATTKNSREPPPTNPRFNVAPSERDEPSKGPKLRPYAPPRRVGGAGPRSENERDQRAGQALETERVHGVSPPCETERVHGVSPTCETGRARGERG
jgi:hypothetical protein